MSCPADGYKGVPNVTYKEHVTFLCQTTGTANVKIFREHKWSGGVYLNC